MKCDYTYHAPCGCRVTFLAESDFHTSRMMPGKDCTSHTGRDQMEARDWLVDWARKLMREQHERDGLQRRVIDPPMSTWNANWPPSP